VETFQIKGPVSLNQRAHSPFLYMSYMLRSHGAHATITACALRPRRALRARHARLARCTYARRGRRCGQGGPSGLGSATDAARAAERIAKRPQAGPQGSWGWLKRGVWSRPRRSRPRSRQRAIRERAAPAQREVEARATGLATQRGATGHGGHGGHHAGHGRHGSRSRWSRRLTRLFFTALVTAIPVTGGEERGCGGYHQAGRAGQNQQVTAFAFAA
jgi:hypothetical protein